VPAPQLHLTFGDLVHTDVRVPVAMSRACANEPVYARLGAIVHDLPYYGNMAVETVRYWLETPPLDEPWAYRMHSVEPGRFAAAFVRAAATTSGLTRDEGLALVGGFMSHCALDLGLHPLVNFCARRDHARFGGNEGFHHRITEKFHALFFHLDRFGTDPIGSRDFARRTRVLKQGSLIRARVEAPIVSLIDSAYRVAYGDAPSPARWASWARSFAHFGVLVSTPMAARNSARVRQDLSLRARYFDGERVSFYDHYAEAERRLAQLTNLAFDYFDARDFSTAAERAFVAAALIDDLAEPTPYVLREIAAHTAAVNPAVSTWPPRSRVRVAGAESAARMPARKRAPASF
jgi:hypothetical protein